MVVQKDGKRKFVTNLSLRTDDPIMGHACTYRYNYLHQSL